MTLERLHDKRKMRRLGKRLKCRPKSLIYWTIIISFIYFTKPLFWPIEIDIVDWKFTDHDKCPACFGESLCPDLYHGRIQLTNWTKYTAARLFNAKNYYHAKIRGHPIILKKLASPSELRELDSKLCQSSKSASPKKDCNSGHSVRMLASSMQVKNEIEAKLDYHKLTKEKHTEILECIETQRLVDILVDRSRYHRSTATVENILTLLMLNPEPVVFMAFNEEEDWPFPKYLGSCGRLAAFDHAGEMLTHTYHKPWDLRVQVARQLLQMAMKFVDNDLEVAMYLTDWSADNFAVDRFGKLTLIDGENFILVDQKHLADKKSPGWDTKHTSQGCDKNFCFAAEDLCTHSVSDHNLLGACKGLLAHHPYSYEMPKGLLHSIPADVLRKHPLITRYLEKDF